MRLEITLRNENVIEVEGDFDEIVRSLKNESTFISTSEIIVRAEDISIIRVLD